MKTLNKEIQSTITPRKALELLKNGNNRFVNNLKADHVEMGNLTELLSKLQPAVYSERDTTEPGSRNSKNATFVENVSSINVRRSVKNIIERSFIIEQMVENGEIGVVGAMYDVETGMVEFYDDVEYIRDEQNPQFSVAELRH